MEIRIKTNDSHVLCLSSPYILPNPRERTDTYFQFEMLPRWLTGWVLHDLMGYCSFVLLLQRGQTMTGHDDVIKWKHFPRCWPFMRGIHRSLVDSLHKGQWRGALMFSLICAWTNGWANHRDSGDFTRHRDHYGITVMNIFLDQFECVAVEHWSLLNIHSVLLKEFPCRDIIMKYVILAIHPTTPCISSPILHLISVSRLINHNGFRQRGWV